MTRGRIYRRGKMWWVAIYWKGRERCESSRSTDKRDAELLLSKRLGEIGADAVGVKRWLGPQVERTLVTTLLDDLITDYEVRKMRALAVFAGRVKVLKESFDREQVRDVDTARVRRYVQERERAGKAAATIRLELAVLHRAFSLAHREGRIGEVPPFPSIHVDNARQGFFERGDFEAVVKELPEYLKDATRFAYLSGWRKMEVMDLRWHEVDLLGRVIKLPPMRSKNKKGRTLALVGELSDIITRRLGEQAVECEGVTRIVDLVFHRDGQPIKDPRRAWTTACHKAGVDGMLFHDLRRSMVRNAIRAGVPQSVVMKMSGHTTVAVFTRYDITSENDIREGQERLQAYLNADQAERTIVPLNAAHGAGGDVQ